MGQRPKSCCATGRAEGADETRDRQDQHAILVGGGVLILTIPRLGSLATARLPVAGNP